MYGLYNKTVPFLGDLENVPETVINSQFYILKLHFVFFSSHDDRFSLSCPQFIAYFTSKLLHFV